VTRFVHSVFCDDIRQEVGNKLSYMGCYVGQMFVLSFPLTLPKLCVAMYAVTYASNPFKLLKFRLLKNEETIAEAEMNVTDIAMSPRPIPFAGDELRMMFTQAFQFPAFQLSEPCVLRVRAITEEGDIKGGGLFIDLAPIQDGIIPPVLSPPTKQ
jgi:hypothetical protein